METTRLTPAEFHGHYPAKIVTTPLLQEALKLPPGQGFRVKCEGKHYYKESTGALKACQWTNVIGSYARRHGYDFKTTHDKEGNLLVYRNP